MAQLLAGLLGAGAKSSPFNKSLDVGTDYFGRKTDQAGQQQLAKILGQQKLQQIQTLGDFNTKISSNQIGANRQNLHDSLNFQQENINAGRSAYAAAGLPEFKYWENSGSGRGLNIGNTRSYLGGNNFVGSLGGSNSVLPSTGSSSYADMNGLSRPDYSGLGIQ